MGTPAPDCNRGRSLASDLALLGLVSIGTAIVGAGLMLARGVLTPTARSFPAVWVPLSLGMAAWVSAVLVHLNARRLGVGATASYPAIVRAGVAALVVLVPPLSLVPLALFLWRTVDLTAPAFLDKRYIVAIYYLMVLGVPISLLAGARATIATVPDPTDPLREAAPPVDAALVWSRQRRVVLLVAAAVVATYFYGPPWGGRPPSVPPDEHETQHFSGLQAIHVGRLPYIDAGADRFAPGSQLFVFGWMKYVGGFTVQGYRQAYAAQHWLATAFVCAVVLFFVPTQAASIGIALAILVFPTFQLFAFGPHRLDGFWGWANMWRYAGEALLGVALPRTVLADRRTWPWPLAALGAVWGVTCLLGQENLIGGIWIIAAVLIALVLSGSVTSAKAGRSLLALGTGSALVMAPVVLIYVGLGQAGPFIRNYFWVVLATASGEENTPWLETALTWWHTTFLLLPVLTLACGLMALLRLRPLHVAGPWSERRAVVFGCFVAAAVVQSGALLRSDVSHLRGVMLVTPFLIGLTAASGGALLGLRSGHARSAVALGVVAVGWALLPWEQSSFTVALSRLVNPWHARVAQHRERQTLRPVTTGAAARLGPGYEEWPRGYSNSDQPVAEFVRLADNLRRIVGNRYTYVSKDGPAGQAGLWYFLADLQPFDLPFEPRSMALFNRAGEDGNLHALADPRRPLGAVVTMKPGSVDSAVALERLGPTPAIHQLPYGREVVLVFVAPWTTPTNSTEVAAIREKATTGDAGAQFNLGMLYESGQGVPQDNTQAMAWYRRAADQGDAAAQYQVGTLFGTGKGVPRDVTRAAAWYRRAAEQGVARAQYSLGLLYDSGQGVPPDPAQAVAWYRKAADQGLVMAQARLGQMYEQGRGIPQDYEKAVEWCTKAGLNQGYAVAQFCLGQLFEKAHGFQRDDREAWWKYHDASLQGLAIAQYHLGALYRDGRGVQALGSTREQNDAQAATWFRRAADQGLAVAQSSLGALYAVGRGVPQDFVEAYTWCAVAAARASADEPPQRYAESCDAIARSMTSRQLAVARRRASAWLTDFEKQNAK